MDVIAYTTELQCLVEMGRFKDVANVVRTMTKSKFTKPDTRAYVVILKAYGKMGDLDGLRTTWKDLQNSDTTVVDAMHYNCMICGLLRLDHWDAARETTESMKSSGVDFTIISYNLMMSFMQLPQAMDLLEKLRASEAVKPNMSTFNNVIRLCAETGDTSTALTVRDQAVEDGLKWDKRTYSSLLIAFKKTPEKAAEILASMESEGVIPNMIHYSTVAFSFLLNREVHLKRVGE